MEFWVDGYTTDEVMLLGKCAMNCNSNEIYDCRTQEY